MLSPFLQARALKEGQNLPNRHQGTDCWHLNNSTHTKLFLAAPSSHVRSVTQDALVRECEIYCTMALKFQSREITWSLDLKEEKRQYDWICKKIVSLVHPQSNYLQSNYLREADRVHWRQIHGDLAISSGIDLIQTDCSGIGFIQINCIPRPCSSWL